VDFTASTALTTICRMATAFVRQILQHLNNAQILRLVPKLYRYKFLILTELPANTAFQPNLDKSTGGGTRLPRNFWVVLTAPPFLLRTKSESLLHQRIYWPASGDSEDYVVRTRRSSAAGDIPQSIRIGSTRGNPIRYSVVAIGNSVIELEPSSTASSIPTSENPYPHGKCELRHRN
jgi:hypothetical protein